jgi:hypothetical protein
MLPWCKEIPMFGGVVPLASAACHGYVVQLIMKDD